VLIAPHVAEAQRHQGGLWIVTPAATRTRGAAVLDVLARRNPHGLRAANTNVVVAVRRGVVVAEARPQVVASLLKLPPRITRFVSLVTPPAQRAPADGIHLRGVARTHPLARPFPSTTSAALPSVGTQNCLISRLHILPMCTPVNASSPALVDDGA
jgi:hypothetical protein